MATPFAAPCVCGGVPDTLCLCCPPAVRSDRHPPLAPVAAPAGDQPLARVAQRYRPGGRLDGRPWQADLCVGAGRRAHGAADAGRAQPAPVHALGAPAAAVSGGSRDPLPGPLSLLLYCIPLLVLTDGAAGCACGALPSANSSRAHPAASPVHHQALRHMLHYSSSCGRRRHSGSSFPSRLAAPRSHSRLTATTPPSPPPASSARARPAPAAAVPAPGTDAPRRPAGGCRAQGSGTVVVLPECAAGLPSELKGRP